MIKKIFILLVVLLLIPVVIATPDIFSITVTPQQITYPDVAAVKLNFENPNSLFSPDRKYKEIQLDISITGNSNFADGKKTIKKNFQDISSAITESFEVFITTDASCKEGDTITITAIVDYIIEDKKEEKKIKEPEIHSVPFVGRYCEAVVCVEQLEQCKDDKAQLSEEIKKINDITTNLKSEKENLIYDFVQCNNTLEEQKQKNNEATIGV